MEFKDELMKSAKSNTMVNMEYDVLSLISHTFEADESSLPYNGMLKLASYGKVIANEPFSINFQPMNYFMIIYTQDGHGQINAGTKQYVLDSDSLILIDCSISFTLKTSILPWCFQIFFMKKEGFELFAKEMTHNILLSKKITFNTVSHDLEMLSSIPSLYNLRNAFIMHKSLTNILCTLCMPKSESETEQFISYVYEIKNYIDFNYSKFFSLKLLEDKYKVSRFKLCRDFSQSIGISPIHYLNSVRLENAKKLLLFSHMNINEISSNIGFENTNNFITLFKKKYGVTPGRFRQMAQEQQSF